MQTCAIRVVIAGTSQISNTETTCAVPSGDDFPICDDDANGYTETNINSSERRTYVLQLDAEMGIKWSTQFGDKPVNQTYCASSAGNYIFIGGRSQNYGGNTDSYTLWEYDDTSIDDYYRPHIYGQGFDATITRFHLTEPVPMSTDKVKNQNNGQLLIYPNPTLNFIRVKPEKMSTGKARIEIFDAQGKLVLQHNATHSNSEVLLDVRTLASGLYSLHYIAEGQSLTQSFIKE